MYSRSIETADPLGSEEKARMKKGSVITADVRRDVADPFTVQRSDSRAVTASLASLCGT